MHNIDKKAFDLLRQQIHKLCGLTISDGKEYLIEHRCAPLFKERGCKSWMDFYRLLCFGDTAFKEEVISVISTHETSFFRDNHPFNSIREVVLPSLVRSGWRKNKFRIWCAAASTGQEPYSLAMLIREFCRSHLCRGVTAADFSILATDISEKVLQKAQSGVFSQHEISRGLPSAFKKNFSTKGHEWIIGEEVRSMVEFKKFNLLNSFTPLGKFDFVMCRNVLIYFDDETKIDIVRRMHSVLPSTGYLMLGATETLAGNTKWFEPEHVGPVIVYRKKS